MAVFTPESAGSLTNLTDLKKVQDYLYRMNEQLQYMFRNLTPEDNNATSAPSLSYTTGENVKIIVDGNEMDIVLENEVIKAINVSTERTKIAADRISINGIASGGNKFVISNQGVPALTDATIDDAAISGGTINNAAITDGTMSGTAISNATGTSMDIQDGSLGPFTLDANGISSTDMVLPSTGQAELAELTLADSFWNGQTVTQVVKTIWDAVFPATP